MKNLRSTLFISFDCGNQGHARPHTEENRLASPKSGESFAADQCMQQIELGLLKKEATDFFKTEVFCQALLNLTLDHFQFTFDSKADSNFLIIATYVHLPYLTEVLGHFALGAETAP